MFNRPNLNACGLYSLLFVVLILSPTILMAQVQVGSDIEGEAPGDRSGGAVSLSADGRRLAVGAKESGDAGTESGHVRVFELNGDQWTKLGQDIDGGSAFDASGTAVSLSADGNRVAIGAPSSENSTDKRGYVRVFELIDGKWSMVGQDIVGEASLDESGEAVAVSADGNRVAIGATRNGSSRGHVRVFDLIGNEWAQVGQDIDGESPFDQSGRGVSLSADGSRVAIGARGSDENGAFSGHVRVFELIGDDWTQVGEDIDGDAAFDQRGGSVSLSADGNRVATGAIGKEGNEPLSGRVRILEFRNDAWEQLGSDIDGQNESGAAVSLSADGSRVAIGSPGIESIGVLSGQVRVFELSDNSWNQVGTDINGQSTGDRSGAAVSISADGRSVAIGSPFNDDNGDASGHVRVFAFTPVGHWQFYGDDPLADTMDNFPDLELSEPARIERGHLVLEGDGNTPTGFARSIGAYSGPDLMDKTLVACLALTGLDDVADSGSALTLSSGDGSVFDGIVFAEREPNRWMAGSENYNRTSDFVPGFEETSTGEYVHLAISHDNLSDTQVEVRGYRNGAGIGTYETELASISEFTNGDAEVNFGMRHRRDETPVGALQANIVEASVYDFVLGEKSIAKLASTCGEPSIFDDGFEPLALQ